MTRRKPGEFVFVGERSATSLGMRDRGTIRELLADEGEGRKGGKKLNCSHSLTSRNLLYRHNMAGQNFVYFSERQSLIGISNYCHIYLYICLLLSLFHL